VITPYFTIFPTQNLLLILSRELKSNIFRKVGMFLVNSNSCWLKWVKKRLEEISGSEITVQMAINTFSNISIKFLQTKKFKN